MISDGSKTVVAAGTRVALASERTMCAWLQVQANPANTGDVYVGGSTVSSVSGLVLGPGDTVPILPMAGSDVHDLREVHVDAAVNGEGVKFIYGTRI